MTELTKSVLRFSGSMAAFGASQLATLVNTRDRTQATNAFNTVTQSAYDNLGRPFQRAFRAGDDTQSEAFELMAGILKGDTMKPDEVLKRTGDFAKRAFQRFGTMMKMKDDNDKGSSDYGFGPMDS